VVNAVQSPATKATVAEVKADLGIASTSSEPATPTEGTAPSV